jgi:NADH dehydrogenase
MKIIIAGGTGFVGSNIANTLINNGHKVILLLRSDKKYRNSTPSKFNVISKDPSGSLDDVQVTADIIINCIGIIREFPRKGITFEKTHVEVVRNLLELAGNNGIKRFLQISALGVVTDGTTGYQRTKLKAEHLIINSGLNYTIFKPSIIIGPGNSFVPTFTNILKKSNIMPVIGNGNYMLQPVHIDDLVSCIANSIDDERTFNRSFEIGGPEKLTFNEIVKIIGVSCGRQNPVLFHIPVIFAKMKAFVWDRFAWFPFTREQIKMLLVDNVTDDDSCFKFYGIEPKRFMDSLGD